MAIGAFGVMAQTEVWGPAIDVCQAEYEFESGLPSTSKFFVGIGDLAVTYDDFISTTPLFLKSTHEFYAWVAPTSSGPWTIYSSTSLTGGGFGLQLNLVGSNWVSYEWPCLELGNDGPTLGLPSADVVPTPQGEGVAIYDCTTGNIAVVDQIEVLVPSGCTLSGDFRMINGTYTVPMLDSSASTGRFLVNNTSSPVMVTMWSSGGGLNISDANIGPVSESESNIASMLANLPNCTPADTCKGVEIFRLDSNGLSVEWRNE